MSDLVGNPEDRFSQNEAHISYLLELSIIVCNNENTATYQNAAGCKIIKAAHVLMASHADLSLHWAHIAYFTLHGPK